MNLPIRDLAWLNRALTHRATFLCLISSVLLEIDVLVLQHASRGNPPANWYRLSARDRSDRFDELAGIIYPEEWARLVELNATPTWYFLDYTDPTLPDQLIEYAFRHGYIEIALEARDLLARTNASLTYKTEGW